MTILVFWDVKPCSLVLDVYRSFEGTNCLYPQDGSEYLWKKFVLENMLVFRLVRYPIGDGKLQDSQLSGSKNFPYLIYSCLVHEWQFDEEEERDCELIWGASPAFAWRKWGNPRKSSVRIAGSWDLANLKHDCLHLDNICSCICRNPWGIIWVMTPCSLVGG
jgi:hypothetical protein